MSRREGMPSTAKIGRAVGGYTIEAVLGVGGMGEVYRARDARLAREVAIKILPAAFTSDPDRRALDTGDLLGKILRIDPTPSADGRPYTIPPDNPFVGVSGARPELWSIGLRNPFRNGFDRAGACRGYR